MTLKLDPLGLRYSQCQEFLPEDTRTLFDEFEGRFKIDRIWRSRTELKLERTYRKGWALAPLAALVILGTGAGFLTFANWRLGLQLLFQLWPFFLALPLLALETLTRRFRFTVDPDGIAWGNQLVPFSDVEEVELTALVQGWPRTYVRLLRGKKPPIDVLRARGALSAFIVHGALKTLLDRYRDEAPTQGTGEAPVTPTKPDEGRPQTKPEEPAATAFDRGRYSDRAFSWSLSKQPGIWTFRCLPQVPFRPRRPAIFAGVTLTATVLLIGNGLLLLGIPLALVGLGLGLTCLRGLADRHAEVTLVWDGSRLRIERHAREARLLDPQQVLSVEPDEQGERVWLRLSLPEGVEPVAAALQVEPILELREHIIASLEGA